ncbi:MAG: hypothetical protein ACR2PT_12435, partial [Endozoicomonas sp.]
MKITKCASWFFPVFLMILMGTQNAYAWEECSIDPPENDVTQSQKANSKPGQDEAGKGQGEIKNGQSELKSRGEISGTEPTNDGSSPELSPVVEQELGIERVNDSADVSSIPDVSATIGRIESLGTAEGTGEDGDIPIDPITM